MLIPKQVLYSQHNEEWLIRLFFADKRGGIFLDVGCATPKKLSTTYFLEKHLGWSGIAVDATPKNISGWADFRPNSQLFSYLITDHYGTIQPFYEAGWLGSVEKVRTVSGTIIRGKKIMLPTMTLSKLLDSNGVESVDFMSIDIEGSEEKALAGFDINRFKPKLVCIEKTPENKHAIGRYFAENDYQLIEKYVQFDRWNAYFTPKD